MHGMPEHRGLSESPVKQQTFFFNSVNGDCICIWEKDCRSAEAEEAEEANLF